MSKKSLESLTESMFYVLMALTGRTLCGTEIADFIVRKTSGRVKLGPGTLYTILAKFGEENLIAQIGAEGRKRTYQVTPKGKSAYRAEFERLVKCIEDAESEVQA